MRVAFEHAPRGSRDSLTASGSTTLSSRALHQLKQSRRTGHAAQLVVFSESILAANLAALERAQGRRPTLGALDPDRVRAIPDAPAGFRLELSTSTGEWLPLDGPVATQFPKQLFVIGPALGGVLDAIERVGAPTRVVALEPDPSVAVLMLARRDWTSWIDQGRLCLLTGPDYRGAANCGRYVDVSAPPTVLASPLLADHRPKEVAAARAVATRLISEAEANANARKRFAGRYLLQSLANLAVIGREGDVASLDGLFRGRPALVVGAGPSLDDNLPALAALQERAVIIGVDTTLRPLLAGGVRPHIVAAVDPAPLNAQHLTGVEGLTDVWLAAEVSLHSSVFGGFAGRTFVFKVSDHQPWPWLRTAGCDRGLLRTWGSVVTSAFDLALRMACNPIIFAGLDLSYPVRRPYCANTIFDQTWSEAIALYGCTRARVRERVISADLETRTARWVRFEDWKDNPDPVPALFIDTRVRPEADCASRLLAALDQPGVDVATCYFSREDDPETTRVVTPYGGSLEAGWRQNTFGGPCFAARPHALAALGTATINGSFALWPAYAAVACRGMSLSVVTTPLYTVTADALQTSGHAELEAVIYQFRSQMPEDFDLGWTLKSALGSVSSARHEMIGQALYEWFSSIPDELLATYAGLTRKTETDPYVRDFACVRERLTGAMTRWRSSEPRVFVYGTGQHTRMLLTLCPEFGRFVEGFIDRQAAEHFLGKPCVTPEQFQSDMADAIVYSSREFEHEMYARLKDARVEHVLLYRESPPAPEATTTVRLRNRFGHMRTDPSPLHTMYRPPSWATGYVSGADATFLFEMIAAQQPSTVVELGVASGASSAVILCALDQLQAAERRVLYSGDVRPTCYFDEAYATGQARRELYPAPRARWHTAFDKDARALSRLLPAGSVDLTFIDANHSHPFPMLDLLQVTAFAKPGSWVILHDVDLPVQHPEFQVFGPRWLFQMWPFNKVKGFDRWSSIGAVQLPENPSLLVPLALSLLDKPWEQTPTIQDVVLPPEFSAAQAVAEARLRPRPAALVTH